MKQNRQHTDKPIDKDWAERMRNQLADYEAPVPDDLWAKVEASLPEVPASKRKARVVPLWARWAAAAVAVAAIMLIAIDDTEKTDTEKTVAQESRQQETLQQEKHTVQETPQQEHTFQAPQRQERMVAQKRVKSPVRNTESTMREDLETAKITPMKSEETVAETKESEKQAAEAKETMRQTHKTSEAPMRELDQQMVAARQARKRHTTIDLYAANGFGNQQNSNGVLMSQQMLANYDYYRYADRWTTRADGPVYLANHQERQKYYQPISFGLNIKMPISSGFSVSTGAVYTRLRSDFTSVANSLVYERQQTLQYIGIPLTVQYNVWRWGRLNVYATAGGQADINIKAQAETEGVKTTLEKDNVQWSVNAALGVEYDIIPMIGIYAEPGIKYYFDNGSHLKNFFKHHPTNFNLQVGVRLNLPSVHQ